ncbi:MAG: TIGR02099 family protein [Burkholderiaceae bacterium]|jgi:uncharacterized protein (TIGR02099 family)|nr:TIGR02099 family protein [Burkholderiaceae bacterium]
MPPELSRSQKLPEAGRLTHEWLRQKVTDAPSWLRRLTRIAFRLLFAAYLVLCALYLGLRYVAMPHIVQYKPNIEKMLSEGIGRQITISGIEASWRGFEPMLKFSNVVLHDSEGREALQLPEIRAAVSWRSFAVFDLRLALLEIERPELNIRRDRKGNIFIAGLSADADANKPGGGMDWLLKQGMITIHEGTVRWLDEMRNTPELSLEKLNFALENSGRRHRLRLVTRSSITQSGEIDIRADFYHSFFADRLSDSSDWEGDLYLALPSADLDPWRPYIDVPYGLHKGAGTVSAWMTFNRAHIVDLTVDVDLNNVSLQLDPKLPVLDLVQFSGRVSARELLDAGPVSADQALHERPHIIALRDIFLEMADGVKMESVDFSAKHVPAMDGKPARTEIRADELHLATLTHLAQYLPLSAEQHRMLDDFSPTGELNNFTLGWEGQYPDLVSYHLSGNFVNLSLNAIPPRPAKPKTATTPARAAIPAIPGFKNLTGRIVANQRHGELELDSHEVTLNLPSYFQKPAWNFEELKLSANWSQSEDNQFSFAIDKMDFLLDGIAITLSGKYDQPISTELNRPGTVDLAANIRRLDMTLARHYVPLQTKEVLRVWLSKAFEEGVASNIAVRLKGNLSDFPFTGPASGDSEFSVRMDVNDVRLNYAPTMLSRSGKLLWEPIEKINGWLTIKGPEIAIHADTAILSGAALSNVDVVVPDMLAEDAFLNVSGSASGELKNFIRFVNGSPVNDVIGGLTEEAKTAGDTSLLLKMQMPLSNMADSKVQGTVTFADNDINLFPDLPVLTAVQGKVHFSDKGFELEGVNAHFLGGNVSLSGGTAKGGGSQVNASGTLTAEGLRKNYRGGSLGKLMGRLSGSLPYTLSITQKKDSKSGYPDIVLESGMTGFGIDLPAPLGKRSAETRPLRVTANALPPDGQTRRDEIRIACGPASAHYEREKRNKTWQLVRGGLGVNVRPELKPGVALNVSMHVLDIQLWVDALAPLFADGASGKGAAGNEPDIGKYVEPRYFSIRTDELALKGLHLTGAAISGTQDDGDWQAKVDSGELKGQLTWAASNGKQTGGKLTARLDTLVIPRPKPGAARAEASYGSVRELPGIDVVVDNFSLYDFHLGRLELVANTINTASGSEWKISRLNLSNPDARLQSSGNWAVSSAGAQKTHMQYTLNIQNAGKLLTRFGYKDVLSGGKGKMHGDLQWAGMPYSLDMPSLSGKIDLNIGKGQFLKVDPGMAKLLGVLSLQSLPRRLKLDFRDIFSEGFAFDEISSKVNITKGVAKTDNITMKGVQAVVLMDGSVDMVKETQNLYVAVLPEINAGAASLAYSVINPFIGVGTLLAQMVLKNPLAKTFAYEYRVTGSWAEPDIKKIEGKESRIRKFIEVVKPTGKDEI